MRASSRVFRAFPFVLLPVLSAMSCQKQAPSAAAQMPATAGAPQMASGYTPVSATVALPTTPAPFATPPVLPGTPDVAGLVAKINPSVVNITTTHELRSPRSGDEGFPFGLDPFSPFGPGRGNRGGGDQVQKQQALGSGFIVDPAGHVVTNAHVVEDADQVKVKLADDREYSRQGHRARQAARSRGARARAVPKSCPLPLWDRAMQLRVGEYVVAIGNPFGLGHTVTMGIVSAKDRAIGAGPYDDFIQTDASINPGNSGGPLFNLKGEVVGINTAINPNGRGIGFAIPVDALKDVRRPADSNWARGARSSRRRHPAGRCGARQSARSRGARGALVADVEPSGPADRAGLKAGDVIVEPRRSTCPRRRRSPADGRQVLAGHEIEGRDSTQRQARERRRHARRATRRTFARRVLRKQRGTWQSARRAGH